MARLGLIGKANTGKTTLFNALCGLEAPTAPHPFSTTEANIGVAKIPDARLDEAGRLEGSEKITHATLDLVDLPTTPGHGGGLQGETLGRLREMEALLGVLRSFASDAVPDDESGTDPAAQAEELVLELALVDAEVFAKRAERAAKEATADAARAGEAAAFAKAAELTSEGTALRTQEWSDAELAAFRDLAPLSIKPVVWVANVAEDADGEGVAAEVAAVVPPGDTVAVLSAKIEEEAAELEPADRAELFEGLGLGEGALAKVVAAANEAMGVLTFFTMGPKESRAWSVRRGATVRQAAGRIHSDLERGFIRADVAAIDDVIADGGWDAAKKAGTVRLEGKEYLVTEGDVIEVRFSV